MHSYGGSDPQAAVLCARLLSAAQKLIVQVHGAAAEMSLSLPVEIPCGRDTRLHLQSLGLTFVRRSSLGIAALALAQVCHRVFALARTTAHARPLADGTAHGARPERLRLVRPRAGRNRVCASCLLLCVRTRGKCTPRARHVLQAAELCRRAHRHYGCCELMSRSGDCAGRDGEAAVATRSRRSCCFRLWRPRGAHAAAARLVGPDVWA